MITAMHSIRDYDWTDWGVGIMRSFLSGGAAAFISGSGGAIAGITPKQQYNMMGTSFLSMGLYRLGEFLQLNGAPKQIDKTLAIAAEASKQAGEAIAEAQTQTPKT
jgi:hypothetical protein